MNSILLRRYRGYGRGPVTCYGSRCLFLLMQAPGLIEEAQDGIGFESIPCEKKVGSHGRDSVPLYPSFSN